jgi:hypothetical protein
LRGDLERAGVEGPALLVVGEVVTALAQAAADGFGRDLAAEIQAVAL